MKRQIASECDDGFECVSSEGHAILPHIFIFTLRLNSDGYIELLSTVFKRRVKKVPAERPCVWRKDSAPCYTSKKKTRNGCLRTCKTSPVSASGPQLTWFQPHRLLCVGHSWEKTSLPETPRLTGCQDQTCVQVSPEKYREGRMLQVHVPPEGRGRGSEWPFWMSCIWQKIFSEIYFGFC